jgi:hypothetical protein
MSQEDSLVEYLRVLAPYIGLTLRVDEHNCCRLRLREDLACQIEASQDGSLQVNTVLGVVPAGRIKALAMVAALRCNGAAPPPYSILSYSLKHSALILELHLPAGTDSRKIEDAFRHHLELAVEWQDALKAGGGFPQPSETRPSAFDLHRKEG